MSIAGASLPDDEEPRRLVFFKEDIDKISKTLNGMLSNTGVSCLVLIDKDGYLLTKEGKSATYGLDMISSIVQATYAATQLTAKLLGEDRFSVQYRQGERERIELYRVGRRTLLAAIFSGVEHQEMLHLYGCQVAAKLTELFDEIEKRKPGDSGPRTERL